MEMIYDILDKLYQMTAFSAIAENPLFIVMYLLAFTLLYLGIVKAMKTFNAIRADKAGVITAILVNSGDAVEEDDPIMKIA